jgi:TonB family protein
MNVIISPRALAGLFFGLGLVMPLAAQNRLYVQEPDDKFHAVFKVSGSLPYIMENGKLVPARGQRLALKKTEEYLPVFISIHDKDSRPTNISVDYAQIPVNNGVHFKAKFEAADPLDDVYLVLELGIPNVGKKIFVYEIGRLNQRTPRSFSADLALGQYMGSGQVELHLFVGGSEVFQSEQPAAYREEMLDRMIAKRIAAVQQANPKPFFGSGPEYPAALRKAGTKGAAVVTMRVTPRGAVEDPVITSATDPAFGEAVLAAARQWRFLPRVEDGRAVETMVSMPIAFEPPKVAEADNH